MGGTGLGRSEPDPQYSNRFVAMEAWVDSYPTKNMCEQNFYKHSKKRFQKQLYARFNIFNLFLLQ